MNALAQQTRFAVCGFFLPLLLVGEALSQGYDNEKPVKSFQSQLLYTARLSQDFVEDGRRDWYEAHACFTIDGNSILVSDFCDGKVVEIDSNTLKQISMVTDRRIYRVWVQNQTGEVLALRVSDDVPDTKVNDYFYFSRGDYKFRVVNYGTLERLTSNQPVWTAPASFGTGQLKRWIGPGHSRETWEDFTRPYVCWLAGQNAYAIPLELDVKKSEQELLIIDKRGEAIQRHKFGIVMGIDIVAGRVEVYHRTGKKLPFLVQRSILSTDLKRVEENQKLYSMPAAWRGTYPIVFWGTKKLRYNDTNPGEVRRFFTEIMQDTQFWGYQDYNGLERNFRGTKSTLSPTGLENLTRFGARSANMGILSALETPGLPEVSNTSSRANQADTSIVLDHEGHVLTAPGGIRFVDAFVDSQKQIFVGSSFHEKSDEVKFYLFRIEQSKSQPQK